MAGYGIGIKHSETDGEQVEHRFALSQVGGLVPGGYHLGSVWLRDSEGLSPSNWKLLRHIAAVATINFAEAKR